MYELYTTRRPSRLQSGRAFQLVSSSRISRGVPPGARRHPPESARAPDVAPVGEEDQLAAVRRPGGREILVHRVVVVAREPALVVLADPLESPGRAVAVTVGGEHVPAALDSGRVNAIRLPSGDQRGSRLTAPSRRSAVDAPVADRAGGARWRRPGTRRTRSAARRRPVRLVVVARPSVSWPRLRAPEPLAPERALHRIDQLAPSGDQAAELGPLVTWGMNISR